MDRRVLLSAMLFAATAMGCSTTAAQAQPSPPPGGAAAADAATTEKTVPQGLAQLWIDDGAGPEAQTLKVRRGATDIVWYGRNQNVRHLLIAFKPQCPGEKPPSVLPPDPTCRGSRCTLDRSELQFVEGTFCYSVVVVRKDGTVKAIDPKLIVNP